MTFLNNGASAIEAVEIAIRVLEDKEITNAGFGSNLSMDGTVECDATIVDHYGRSGAVGAVGCMWSYSTLENATRAYYTRYPQPHPPRTTRPGTFNKATISPPGPSKFAGRSGSNGFCI